MTRPLFSQESNHQFIAKLLESINEGETVVIPCIESETFLDLLQIWLRLNNSTEGEISESIMNYDFDNIERMIMGFVTTGRIYNWLTGQAMKDRTVFENRYCILQKTILKYGSDYKVTERSAE